MGSYFIRKNNDFNKRSDINKNIKLIVVIILTCLVSIIKITQVNGIDLGSIGEGSTGSYSSCGKYNGCMLHVGYNYTIIKLKEEISDHGIRYDRISATRTAYFNDNSIYNSGKYSDNFNRLRDDIKQGGELFESILSYTGVGVEEFVQNNYYIMIEPVWKVWVWPSKKTCDNKSNDCYKTSEIKDPKFWDAKTLASYVKNNYDTLTGFRSMTYDIPCLARIPGYSSNDSFCKASPSNNHDDQKHYLNMAIGENSLYGRALIYAKDVNIPSYNVKIIKADENRYKINSDVSFDLYRGDCYSGSAQRLNFSGSTNLKLYKGDYCLVEVNAPDGYIKGSNKRFSVGGNSTITVTNKRQTGSMTIEKYDTDTRDKINGAEFAIYYGSGCTGSIFKSNITVNGSRRISDIPTGNYSVKELNPPNNYQIGDTVCENIYIGYNKNESVPFFNKYTNNITIIKKDEKNNTIQSSERQATFKICSDYNCNKVLGTLVTRNGKVTSKRYPVGTYYIKEEQAPLGYEGKSGVTEVKITHGTNTVEIKNTNKCIVEFNKLINKNDMVSRLNLYNDLKEKYKFDYKNLLNLSNQTAESACTSKDVNYDVKKGCLSTSINTIDNSFSQDNLSNFTDVIKIRDKSAYCNASFKLINNLNDLNKYEFISKYNFNNIIGGEKFKAGLMVLNRTSPEVAKGILTNTCYVFNTNSKSDVDFTINYNDYIGELKFNNEQLEIDINNIKQNIVNEEINTNQNYVKLTKEIEVTYNLKPVFAVNGYGVILNKECDNCKFLGYGFASNLNQSTENDIGVPFSIKLNKLTNQLVETKNQCVYSVENDIIDKPDPNEEKLNIEFRMIDISNPFPGKAGLGRKVGSNWCDKDNCEVESNSIIKKYITDANDSYNKNKATNSLYTIRLTSETLEEIREYNSKNNYDNYNDLECDKDNKCKSKFLRDILNVSKNG